MQQCSPRCLLNALSKKCIGISRRHLQNWWQQTHAPSLLLPFRPYCRDLKLLHVDHGGAPQLKVRPNLTQNFHPAQSPCGVARIQSVHVVSRRSTIRRSICAVRSWKAAHTASSPFPSRRCFFLGNGEAFISFFFPFLAIFFSFSSDFFFFCVTDTDAPLTLLVRRRATC